ncbi:MAG: magnesium/cobalt transporter CorA [Prochlorococcaceae cyanobacterium]
MLHPTPGALSSRRLDERPANYPTALYMSGGRAACAFSLVAFQATGPQLQHQPTAAQLGALRAAGIPLWLRVSGLADAIELQRLLTPLGVPPELLPPLVDVPQRPRVEGFEGAVLVVLHRLSFARDPSHLISSQLGLLLLPGVLITLEEAPSANPFAELTAWLERQEGSVEQRDLDDILHYLIDEVLDALFPMLEQISSRLDDLESATLRDPKPKLLSRTFTHRANLRTIRSQIWPLRHQIRVLLRQRQNLLGPEALGGFQEMAELVELLFEHIELLRGQCDAITQAYAASVGNRMNQVMKTLTILTSIFAPLTFIAGIYGMNFNIPELHWRYGYAYSLVLMALIALIQAWWLWRRGWFQDWTLPR